MGNQESKDAAAHEAAQRKNRLEAVSDVQGQLMDSPTRQSESCCGYGMRHRHTKQANQPEAMTATAQAQSSFAAKQEEVTQARSAD